MSSSTSRDGSAVSVSAGRPDCQLKIFIASATGIPGPAVKVSRELGLAAIPPIVTRPVAAPMSGPMAGISFAVSISESTSPRPLRVNKKAATASVLLPVSLNDSPKTLFQIFPNSSAGPRTFCTMVSIPLTKLGSSRVSSSVDVRPDLIVLLNSPNARDI